MRIPESEKFLLVEYGIWENFPCGMRNTGSGTLGFGIRNTAQGIRNKSFTKKDLNPVPGIRNPQPGIKNPRLSWIPLHGAILQTKIFD